MMNREQLTRLQLDEAREFAKKLRGLCVDVAHLNTLRDAAAILDTLVDAVTTLQGGWTYEDSCGNVWSCGPMGPAPFEDWTVCHVCRQIYVRNYTNYRTRSGAPTCRKCHSHILKERKP